MAPNLIASVTGAEGQKFIEPGDGAATKRPVGHELGMTRDGGAAEGSAGGRR